MERERLMIDDRPHTTLALIRHVQARAPDGSYGAATPLSELGRHQAAAMVGTLSHRPRPAAVYTSPYLRAVQTAAPLCRAYAIAPRIDPRLAEYALGYGALDAAVVERPDLLLWRPEHQGVAGGERLGAFAARIAAFCDEVVARHVGDWVAIFTHAGTIDAVLRWAVGLPAESCWQHEFNLATASITELVVWPSGRVPGGAPRYTAIRHVGDVRHLGALVANV